MVYRNTQFCFAYLSTTSGNQYHTVGATYTEHCGSRSIFQYGNGFHFIGVERSNTVAGNTVNQNQRIHPVGGTGTTQIKCYVISTGTPGSLHRGQSRQTS
ncbi:hypothetical protein IMSAGC001_03346 [Bacteroides acidifaciens]|uniref:Uncharacterized protein n=1 Tax=Bacteroides acidifaciens TaxID=85831 RepID=A0A7J0A707_9BACE|nr:hypothetical protein IMSAGC001_03346 [Bacteroides acidifaciens]